MSEGGANAVTCREAVSRLWEYLDGELEAGDAGAIREHLETCSRCYPHTDFQRAYQRFLARTAHMPVPPDLRRRVFEAIIAEDAGGGPGAGPTSADGAPATGGARRRWNVRGLLGRIFGRS
jgi:anti-sigma factor (TIGR02949 family)